MNINSIYLHAQKDGLLMSTDQEKFRTFRGYDVADRKDKQLTPSMEDYLEMIYRISLDNGFTRINDLAKALNVKPPSATSMVQRLHNQKLLCYEKYGVVLLTERGQEVGHFLLKRHLMLEKFFLFIGVTNDVLKNVERIEHNLTPEATRCLSLLVNYIEENPTWFQSFQDYFKIEE